MAEAENLPSQRILVGTDDLTGTDLAELARAAVDHGDHINMIPWQHNYLHEGRVFVANNYNPAVGDPGALETVITVGSTYNLHVIASAQAGGDFLGELYEDVSSVVGGTAVTPSNRNRESSAASTGTVLINPASYSLVGATQLEEDYVPGGTGGNALGGAGSTRDEYILKRDTTYLYRITNLAGQAKPMSLHLEWYEHLPVEGVS
jgi:hypothetical protein